MFDWLFSKGKVKKESPAKLFPSPYINQSIEQELRRDFLPHYFHVETPERLSSILDLNPQGTHLKRSDFFIEGLRLNRYLSGVLEGDPELCLFGELALPLIQRCKDAVSKEQVLQRLQGFHYLVPTSFYGPLDGWIERSANQLPKWQYTVNLRSADRDTELTFVFRVPKLLGEKELTEYVAENADWSLAQEYIP